MEYSWWTQLSLNKSHDVSKYHLENISMRILQIQEIVDTFSADYKRMFYYRHDITPTEKKNETKHYYYLYIL